MRAPRNHPATPLMLTVIYAPGSALLGRDFKMPASEAITVGRGAKNTVVLDEDSASRHHARFELRNNEWWVVDLGSTNGVTVNDEPTKRSELAEGDRIRIGRTIFKLRSGQEAIFDDRHIFQISDFDGLTKLHNRRHLSQQFATALQQSERDGTSLSLVMIDLDHFKKINDTHGHLAGDAILQGVADLLRAHQRPGDAVARYGGEEFVWLLPSADLQTATELAGSLRQAIEEHPFLFEGKTVTLTASFGVAQRKAPTTDPLEFLRAADDRLFEAKRGGRNRVVS